jgi:phage repressor protein C with HTH and peptisase S24 domain
MEPALWDGDLVVINTADTSPHDGDAFAMNYEGELVIKRLRRDAGEWWATSDNADQRRFAPKRCTEDVKIIGRVVYKQSERI